MRYPYEADGRQMYRRAMYRIISGLLLQKTEMLFDFFEIDFDAPAKRRDLKYFFGRKIGIEFVPVAMDYVSLADDGCRSCDSVP